MYFSRLIVSLRLAAKVLPLGSKNKKYTFILYFSRLIVSLLLNCENMARKKKPLPIYENITITDIAAEGKSLVRLTIPAHDGTPESQLVVFVPFCVPGDIVDLQITRKKHSYAEARVIRFRKFSDVRTTPPCHHFGVCGGCKWQELPYEAQLKAKQQQVYDQLTRIGHLQLPMPGESQGSRVESRGSRVESRGSRVESNGCIFHTILGSKDTYHYRNKLDFACSNKRYLTMEEIQSLPKEDSESRKSNPAIGFHITGAFDKVLPIEKCWLMDDQHNEIRNAMRDYALEHGISFFDLRQQTGLLRDVIIRCSNSGEWMVILQVHFSAPVNSLEPDHNTLDNSVEKEKKQIRELLQHISNKFLVISSLLWVDNQKCNDTFGDLPVHVFKGNDHIFLEMEDLRFKVGPKSFYQTNTEQAYELYKVAREFAFRPLHTSPNFGEEKPLVYDLYTGTGTIANFVARKARKVIGIEYVPEAIEDAKINSQINNIGNTLFFAGDMKDILTDEFIAEHGHPDIIITDPPRAGMHSDVINVILRAQPQRIVYVSCNPATQARDLEMLCQDYNISEIQPVDMFPHTPHVENVVMMEKRVES